MTKLRARNDGPLVGKSQVTGTNRESIYIESEKQYAVKPVNCPGHVQIFNQGLKSYRDLPLKWRNLAAVTVMSHQAHYTV